MLYTGSRKNRESTVHGSLQNHAADHGTLVVVGSQVPGFSGEATTTSRLTLGLLTLPPVLIWTPWYEGVLS